MSPVLESSHTALAASPQPRPATNTIVPTGQTATQVTVNGAVTDVTTTTMSGGNAYNAFSQFKTVAGSTVDLEVPSTANELINTVRNSPVSIDGILNSYKSGQIGGNVVFVDPYGLIVGAQGVMNVGSLMVSTPTPAFLDQLISPSGAIGPTAAAELAAGDVPLSPDGRIYIRGRINANTGVTLQGTNVGIGSMSPAAVHAAEFAATVNARGVTPGAAIVVNNGGIDILAAGNASVGGQLSADGAAGRNAGSVTITAGRDIAVAANANVTARGAGADSSGGLIKLLVQQDLTVAAGALFDASAGTSGNGGTIEISAVRNATISGGTYNAGAIQGTPGTVLFDPTNLTIDGPAGANTSISSDGAAIVLTASNSITVTSTGYLVSRAVASGEDATSIDVPSTGNSGNISLSAPLITLDAGAQILAFATGSYAAGSVTLDAGSSGSIVFATPSGATAQTVIAARAVQDDSLETLADTPSSGASGNITLQAGSINFGNGVNNGTGLALLANGTDGFGNGTIELDVPTFEFTAAAPILTRGANLLVVATGAVTFDAGSLVNSRHVGDSADPTDPTTAVLDAPGNITIEAGSFNFPSAGINTAGGASLFAGGYGGADGFLGGTITLSAPSLTVSGTIASQGANLVLNADSGNLTIDGTAVLVTRQLAAGADPTDPTVASTNVSGDLSLISTSGNVVVQPGAQLLTFATDTYYGGNINLTAAEGSVTFASGPGTVLATRSFASGAGASLAASASDGFSGDITIAATSVNLAGINTANGPVIIAGTTGGGLTAGTLTIDAPTVSIASGAPWNTGGANLAIDATSSITLGAGAAINTRMVASGSDPSSLSVASTGDSGSVTLTAPTITMDAGSGIFTDAVGGKAAGSVALTASSALSLASGAGGSVTIATRGIASGAGSIAGATADTAAGDISLSAPTIDLSNGVNTTEGYALLAAGGNGYAGGTIGLSVPSLDLTSGTTILTLGANIALTATSTITLENGSVIDTRVTSAPTTDPLATTSDASGNITLTAQSVELPSNAVNSGSSVLLLAGATGTNAAGTITFNETNAIDFSTAALTVDTYGAGFVLNSAGALTIGPNVAIDTRLMSGGTFLGASGNIGLIGSSLGIGNGINSTGTAALLAAGGNGYAAGIIMLQATSSGGLTLGNSAPIASSGANLAILSAGALTVSADETIDAAGQALSLTGTTLSIDPTATLTAATLGLAQNTFDFTTNQSFDVQALTLTGDSITIESGVVISTRASADPLDPTQTSTGNSGSISLSAQTIVVDGTLDAGVTNRSGTTYTAGNVTLTAADSEIPFVEIGGSVSATASITVAGAITGQNISLLSSATADASYNSTTESLVTNLATSVVGGGLLGGQIGIMLANATATTEVQSSATLNATGDVTVQALTETTASNKAIQTSLLSIARLAPSVAPIPVPSGVAGTVTGISKALVDSGATIDAGGTLTVDAHNTDTIGVSTTTLTTNNTIALAVAFSQADVQSTATIASGANIAAGAVQVAARNDNSWSTTVSVSDMGLGTAGVALALSYDNISTATAQVGANLTLTDPTPAAGADLLIEADSVNALDIVGASASSGSTKLVGNIVSVLSSPGTAFNNLLVATSLSDGDSSSLFDTNSGATTKPRLAFAVALNLDDQQTADATLGNAAGQDGPTISAVAPVAVYANVYDGGIQTTASSQVNSNDYATNTSQNPGTSYAISAAIAISVLSHTADAEIGANTDVTAPAIGVAANVEVPLYLPITNWSGPSAIFGNLVSILLGTALGDSFPEVETSGANAVESAQSIGGSGAVDYFGLTDNTTAWVGQGAQLIATTNAQNGFTVDLDSFSTGPGQTAIPTTVPSAFPTTAAWTTAIGVLATDTTQIINIGGGLNVLGLPPVLGNAPSNESKSVGGAFTDSYFAQTTLAGIGADATVLTDGAVAVAAASSDEVITIVPSAGTGYGGQLTVSGMVGLADLNNVTHASISNTDDVVADIGVSVTATQLLNFWVVAGSVEEANLASVGAGVAINDLTTNTQAYIGDNAADDPTTLVTAGFTAPVAGITTPSVLVSAVTSGQVVSLGIAASVTVSNPNESDISGSNQAETSGDEDDPVLDDATPDSFLANLQTAFAALNQSGAAAEDPAEPEFGIGVSGSAAVDYVALTTAAHIDGATITDPTLAGNQGAGDAVTVQALRNTWLVTAAGGAALVSPGSPSSENSSSVASAAALDLSNSTTTAAITGNSDIENFRNTAVQALQGGEQVVIGIDISGNSSDSTDGLAIGVSASVSVAQITDRVAAWVDSSTIAGSNTDGMNYGGALAVTAYDDTDIGIGGGSIYAKPAPGDGGGFGAALTYAGIANPASGPASDAYINDSSISGYDSLSVSATDASVIMLSAASIAGGANTNGLSGAVTLGVITTTTQAEITGNSTIAINDTVAVTANGADQSALDALLTANGRPSDPSPIDFSGSIVLNQLNQTANGAQPATGAPTSLSPGAAIIAVAGELNVAAGSESVANVGLSIVVDVVSDSYLAAIKDSTVTTDSTGSVTVAAADNTQIIAVSVGVSVSTGNFAGLGSVSGNIIRDSATATVGDAGGGANNTSVSTGNLSVLATDTALTESFAGNVTVSSGGPAAGAAIAYTQDDETTAALLTHAKLNVDGETDVAAATTGAIGDAAFTVAVSGENLAFSGAVAVDVVGNTTTANATANTLNDPTVWGVGIAAPASDGTSLVVTAWDNSSIDTLAVSASVGSTAGVGGAIAFGDISNTILAAIDGDNGAFASHPAIDVQGVLVQGLSTASIETLAAGLPGGESVGAGGSVTTNIIATTVSAAIDQGAIVSATGNVYVLASDNNTVQVIAGVLGVSAGGESGVGVGFSAVVNDITSTATADIDGSQVDAAGQTPDTTVGGVSSVNDGVLNNAPDIASIQAPSAATFDLSEQQETEHGLAVVATSDEQAIANTVSAGLQASLEPGAGVSVNTLVNVIGGSTTADISNSLIDTGLTANPLAAGYVAPAVFVNASSHAYSGNFIVSLAGSLYAGVAGVIDDTEVDHDTNAYISGGQIGAIVQASQSVVTGYEPPGYTPPACTSSPCTASDGATTYSLTTSTLTPEPSVGAVTVNAASTADTANIAIGAGAGAGAVVGVVAVNVFSPTTTAAVKAGTPVVANSLTVAATAETGTNVLGGTAAYGAGAGAGSFGVLVSNDTTDAYVGDQANETTPTILTLPGSLAVNATTTDNFNSLVISGADGGNAGIAGMANVVVIANNTTAGLYLVTVGTTGAAEETAGAITQDPNNPDNYLQTIATEYGGNSALLTAPATVNVDANETVNVAANAGSLAVSNAGAGAGATVVSIASNTTAVAFADTINATGTVGVNAASTKDVQVSAVSLGAGSSTGIGAAAALILVGSGNEGGIASELNANGSGTLSAVNGTSTGGASGGLQSPDISASQQQSLTPTFSISNTINNGATDAVTASVEGGTITAAALDVTATGTISSSNIVGGAGLGMIGVGGAVGYTLIYDTVTATAYDGQFTAGTVLISALAQDGTPALSGYGGTAYVLAIAGAAGDVGIGAAVADATVDNTVSASVGGTVSAGTPGSGTPGGGNIVTDTGLTVTAQDASTATTDAYGAAAGEGAVGVVVSTVTKTSDVQADVLNNTVLSGFSGTSVSATQLGALTANSVGAAAGLLAAGTGAASTATSLAQVTAATGTDVTLPDGDVSLTAMNDPIDDTSALGVGAGLYFAAGVGVAESFAGNQQGNTADPIDPTQSIYTAVTLGAGTVTDATRTGTLTLTATSVSALSADGTAGSGGAVSGAAAVGLTNDTALTQVNFDTPASTLYAGSITMSAAHTTNFSGVSNSGSASVVGGSGSQTLNTVDADTTVNVGDDTAMVTPGMAVIGASTTLVETTSGDAASGAGGGVLTGAAALVNSSFTLGASVDLGTNVSIASGTDPVLQPGGIAIGADILADVGDTATLNTGGVLDGAASQNTLTLTATTNVAVGADDALTSAGAVGVGSFVQVQQADPAAYSNTYGLAAVGNAEASATVTATQTVTIGQQAAITGDGSVSVTAGLDPSGSVPTSLSSSPNAMAYAYGLVGVPVVTANATVTSDTTLTIDSGAQILSVLNVTLGAYPGAPSATPSASGAGDVLGVPVSSGTATPNTSTTGAFIMNGSAVAGEYATLLINIDPSCGTASTCAVTQVSGLPATLAYDESEALGNVIAQYWTDETSQIAIAAGIAPSPVPTLTIGTLYAAGGLVYVNADTISGTGSITANGAPSITVNNPSPAYLVLGPISIPGQPGGSIIFTGSAGAGNATGAGITLTQSGDSTPQITIDSTYSSPVGAGSLYGPAQLFTSPIVATTGNLSIDNAFGSIALPGTVIALQETITAPNGVALIGDSASPTYLAGNPFSEWDASILYPGGNPNTGTPNANTAIAYVANAEYSSSNGSTSSLNLAIYGVADGGSSVSGSGSNSGIPYISTVFYGGCEPAAGGDCSQSTANSLSPAGQSYTIDPTAGPHYYYFALIPTEPLGVTVQSVPATSAFTDTSAGGGVLGRQVTIEGKFIAVGGDITSGSPTQWSVDLPASLDATLAADLYSYLRGGPSIYAIAGVTIGANDTVVPITYNAAQNQLIVTNTYAASGPGEILLKGEILGTNPYAQINVNTGLGSVTVTNETGVPLTVQNISVGSATTNSALVSTVQIIDTLQPDTVAAPGNWIYQYTAGGGLTVATSTNLGLICSSNPNCVAQANYVLDGGPVYEPVSGTRLQWILQAGLTQTMVGGLPSGDWTFNSVPGTTNPWEYRTSTGTLTTTPTATLLTNGSPGDPAFSETITGSSDNGSLMGVAYHGCSGSSCDYGFPNGGPSDGKGGSAWYYDYVSTATLDLTVTVRADYSFGINFAGNTTGAISVTSDSPVTVVGNLYNPSGTTALTSTGTPPTAALNDDLTSSLLNGIYFASGAQITANNLTLTTNGTIGTEASPLTATITQATPGSGPYGTLAADAGAAGVYLNLQSGAAIDYVISATQVPDAPTVYGDVVLNAEFDLTAIPNSFATISGRDITMNVVSGGIGTAASPMDIDPNGTGGLAGGVVNMTALGDIFLRVDAGNLLVGNITSTGGNVTLTMLDGAVLDAAGQTPVSVLSAAQVVAVQQELGLSTAGESSSAVMANTVNPIQAQVNADYAQFWQLETTLLPNGTVSGQMFEPGSTFTLSTAGLAAYKNLAAQGLGIAPSVVTDAQVQTYANNLYQKIVTVFAPVFSTYLCPAATCSDWRTQAEFVTESANAPTVFSPSQIDALEVDPNVSPQALLENGVSYVALQPVGSSIVGIGSPNISGRVVTVTESSAVGQLGTPVVIPYTTLADGTLSATQAAALALASTPGQATLLVTPTGGTQIAIPITELTQSGGQYYYVPSGAAAEAVTLDGVQISEPAPLFLATTGTLDVVTSGPLFAQSTIPTLPVGTVSAGGAVSITAPDSIVSALLAGETNITTTGGAVSLIAGTGSIGSSSLPLVFAVNDAPSTGALATASAGQDLYLSFVGGDLTLGGVFAGGLASIGSDHSILNATDTLNISATSIALSAQDNIGSTATPLQVQVGSTGALSGTAGGSIDVFSPTEANQSPVALIVSDLTSGTSMVLGADASIDATGLTAQNGNLTVAAGTDASVSNASADGAIALSAVGSLTVGGLTTTGGGGTISLIAGASGTVTQTSGSTISGSGSVTVQGESFAMTADATTLDAEGPVDITTTGDALLGAVSTTIGTITVTAGTTGRILSNGDTGAGLTANGTGGGIALSATGDIGSSTLSIAVSTPTLSAGSGGDIFLHGIGTLEATSLSAPNGSVAITDTAALTVDSLNAGTTASMTGATGLSAGPVTTGGDATLTATTGPLLLTGNVTAGGSATFDAAVGSATLAGVTAQGTITATAHTLLSLSTTQSHATQTFTGGTGVTFGTLTTTVGGDMDVAATTGDITGSAPGTIDAVGGVTLTASGGAMTVPGIQAGTTVTLTAADTATVGTLSSGGSESLTAGTLALGSVTTTGITGDPGDVDLVSQTGRIRAGALLVAGTTQMTSNAGIQFATLAGGEAETFQAQGPIGFTTIGATTGDIVLAAGGTVGGAGSPGSSVTGSAAISISTSGQILLAGIDSSGGGLTLSGAAGVTIQTVNAPAGEATISSNGTVNLGTTALGLALGIDAGRIVLGSATTGGSETLTSTGATTFAGLTANGSATADPGDISVTAGGAINGAHLTASRDVSLTSTGAAVTVAQVTAGTGSVQTRAGGALDLTAVSAAQQFGATSGASLTIGTATSGGTQTLAAQTDVVFTQLTTTGTPSDAGDVDITATAGAIRGGDINAHGSVNLSGNGIGFGTIAALGNGMLSSSGGIAGQSVSVGGGLTIAAGTGGNGDLSVGTLLGTTLSLNAAGGIDLTQLTVTNSLTLAGNTITGTIIQAPAATGPLSLDLTGDNGGLARNIALTVNAPNGLVIGQLSAVNASLVTTANNVTISNADVPGNFLLDTPDPLVVMDNTDTTPQAASNVQLYQPGGVFFLEQLGRMTITDAYFVAYDQADRVVETAFTNGHANASPWFIGTSMSRDADWNTTFNLLRSQQVVEGDEDFALSALWHDLEEMLPAVTTSVKGPAVNLGHSPAGGR